MNNISNCGTVAHCNGKTYLADMKNFSGTAVVDMFGNTEKIITDAIMWYSVVVGEYIFFSNQKYNNYLCLYNSVTGQISVVKEVPCKNIVKSENYLYFIDEKSQNLMRYGITDGSYEQFSDDKIEVFSIYGDMLYYSSLAGIGAINITNRMQYAVLVSVGEKIGYWRDMLIYSDFKMNSVLSVYQPSNGNFFRIEAVCTNSFVTDDNYIFAVNNKENRSICRIDIAKGEIMRIFGEEAYELQIAGSDLYFMDRNRDWCKLSTSGDGFTRIRIN